MCVGLLRIGLLRIKLLRIGLLRIGLLRIGLYLPGVQYKQRGAWRCGYRYEHSPENQSKYTMGFNLSFWIPPSTWNVGCCRVL